MKIDFNSGWIVEKESGEQISVSLPHDAMIHEKREPDCESGSAGAYFPGGRYVYRKNFSVDKDWINKEIYILFEGVYRNAKILLNGKQVGKITYGYTERRFCITEFLQFGEQNGLVVEVDNSQFPNSRWYTGSGIYRPVSLEVFEKEHIMPDGIKVETISYKPAKIRIRVNHRGGMVQATVSDGKDIVARADGDDIFIDIPDAKLWSAESPSLYQLQVSLVDGNSVMDKRTLPFGIRVIEKSESGLLINGQNVLLRGGCIHHDNGILGACAYPEAEERKVRIMKEYGFNAIRSSHNPCSRALLDACDKYGMYVVDESWDMWFHHKSKYDYASDFYTEYKDDLKAMVEKDYNHSCVLMYSIGNEISEPASKEGMKVAEEIIELVHTYDPFRLVTAGINLMIVANAAEGKALFNAEEGGVNMDNAQGMLGGGTDSSKQVSEMDSTMFNMIAQGIGSGMNHSADSDQADKATTPILDALDIAGYNYASGRYPLDHELHPDRMIFGSETLPQDIYRNWQMVEEYPMLVGDFMWTAFDYLGEAGLGAWSYEEDAMSFDKPYPWIAGGAGVIDLIGNGDGEALYAKAVWGLNRGIGIAVTPPSHPGKEPFKSVWRGTNAIPSWSWQGCEGNPVTIEVYTKASYVELYLNGSLIAKQQTAECKAMIETTYAPGVLEAVGYLEDGTELERGVLHTAEGEKEIKISMEEDTVTAKKLLFIHVDICGKDGIVESNQDGQISLYVEGGELLAFGSAIPRTEESYHSGRFNTYYGRALAVVRAGSHGKMIIRAKGTGYQEKELVIPIKQS